MDANASNPGTIANSIYERTIVGGDASAPSRSELKIMPDCYLKLLYIRDSRRAKSKFA